MGKIMDGKLLAKEIKENLKQKTDTLKQKGIQPQLATILVGKDPASQVYVKNKIKACEKVGIKSLSYNLPEDVSEGKLVSKILELNNNKDVNAILVQLPLPSHISTDSIISTISPKKDVDCFHPQNLGRLFSCKSFKEIEEKNLIAPCTPYGIIQFFKKYNVELKGKNAVIVGRSNIVGKPLSILLLSLDATVTICHSKTKNLKETCNNADILIAAIGKPEFVRGDFIKEGAVVIDVGVNRTGEELRGDVCFKEAIEKVSLITPVPKGVGPMTIAMLLKNTIKLTEEKI
jgi:methylenetetrahydrofolate dehydrogenase (NADP+)/methenyltetrahydrofolate cyclohydrolase